MDGSEPKRRWYRVTPDRVIVGLILAECLLWLSDQLGWWHKGYAVLTSIGIVAAAMAVVLLWFAAAVVLHRRFQFGIRSLLILAVAVALPCSWLATALRQAKEQSQARMALSGSRDCDERAIWSMNGAEIRIISRVVRLSFKFWPLPGDEK